jgi:hypothetical protein
MMLLRKPNRSLAQTEVREQESVVSSSQSPLVSQLETTEPTTAESVREDNLLLVPDSTTQPPEQENVPPRTLEVPPAPAPSRESLPLYTGPVPTEPNGPQNYQARGNVLSFEASSDAPSQASIIAFENEQHLEPVSAFEAQPLQQEPMLAFESATPAPSAGVLAESFVAPEEAFETATPLTDESEASDERSSVLAFEPSESEGGDSSLESPQPNTDAPPAELSVPETATRPEDETLLDTTALEPEAVPADLLQAGTLIPATLTKDVVLTEGETRQVIADSDDTWCGEGCPPLRWLGEVTLLESGRLEVVFKQVVIDNKVIEINGTAFGEDNAQGLPAHIADTTPTLLADLLRSSAGGVTDYVEAQTGQKRFTSDDDTTVTEETVPPLLDFILGRAANTLQMPDDETSVIRLAAVEKGTRLEVLYVGQN